MARWPIKGLRPGPTSSAALILLLPYSPHPWSCPAGSSRGALVPWWSPMLQWGQLSACCSQSPGAGHHGHKLLIRVHGGTHTTVVVLELSQGDLGADGLLSRNGNLGQEELGRPHRHHLPARPSQRNQSCPGSGGAPPPQSTPRFAPWGERGSYTPPEGHPRSPHHLHCGPAWRMQLQ